MSDAPKSANPTLEEIKEVVNNKIRPSLNMHGGDMEIVSYENNVLKISYRGACGGCPGAAMSTLPMIRDVLCSELKADINVEIA